MTGIALQKGIVYGPILSRRLGRSLGINILPIDCKVCSYDCVYCEYGRTDIITPHPACSTLPTLEEVSQAVQRALKKPRTIETITFSGNGEPTLHPQFPEIVCAVMAIRDALRPQAQLAILSNSSMIHKIEIQKALGNIEAPMMKIDAGDAGTFKAINRPGPGVEFLKIINGLKFLPHLIVQTMLIDGAITNIRGEAYEALADLMGELKPKKVHIYSIERPTTEFGVKRVEPEKLQRIAEDIHRRFGISVEAFWRA
jgi:wyosine [tRNA(Phe)-imidazoG37] synthetase (radical SAM superfamily)